jgi:hypothetical protein
MSEMGFERALAAMKAGLRVARTGWNGKRMYLRVLEGVPAMIRDPISTDPYVPSSPRSYDAQTVKYPRHIAMFTATGEFVPWLASVTDLMAEDWMVVDSTSQRLTESAPV